MPAIAKLWALTGTKPGARVPDPRLDIAQCFLSLSNLDNGVFERLGRYEMGLWRQVRQTLFTLERLRWRTSRARCIHIVIHGRPFRLMVTFRTLADPHETTNRHSSAAL